MKAKTSKRFALFVIILLSLIGLLSLVGHYFAPQPTPEQIMEQNIKPGLEWFRDQRANYLKHSIITFLHIVPAFFIMLLAPIQIVARLRSKFPSFHRIIGRVLVVSMIPVGLTGFLFGIVMPFGGISETIVTSLIFAGFLFSGFAGYYFIRIKQIGKHRVWMSRMLAFAYTPITMRLIYAIGFLALDLDAKTIFGPSLLIGAMINLLLCEYWIKRNNQIIQNQSAIKLQQQTKGA